MEITVSRKAHFNAAHGLFNKEWSEKKNSQVFGKCNYPNYHGHNYELIVSVTGKINPDTGYVIDMGELKNIIKNELPDILIVTEDDTFKNKKQSLCKQLGIEYKVLPKTPPKFEFKKIRNSVIDGDDRKI